MNHWGSPRSLLVRPLSLVHVISCLSMPKTYLEFRPGAYLPREGNGTPLQYSCLENPMDRGACWAAVHGVAKSRTQLRDFSFTFHFHALEKEMATHIRVLAWRIYGVTQSWTRLKQFSSSSSSKPPTEQIISPSKDNPAPATEDPKAPMICREDYGTH